MAGRRRQRGVPLAGAASLSASRETVCQPVRAGDYSGMATASLTRPRRVRPPRLWTYTELRAAQPETPQPVELWNGEIVTAPSPSPEHQDLIFHLARAFHAFVSAHDLGKVYLSPSDVVLSERRVVPPDLVFIARERLGIVRDCIRGVPDLTLEVISEASWRRDRLEKKALYEQYGVREYWLADPDSRTIEVYALVKGAYRLHAKASAGQVARSKLLVGFSLSWPPISP